MTGYDMRATAIAALLFAAFVLYAAMLIAAQMGVEHTDTPTTIPTSTITATETP